LFFFEKADILVRICEIAIQKLIFFNKIDI